MAKVNLSGMTVEALMDLQKRVDQMLFERRAEIEKRLEWMGRQLLWLAAEAVGHVAELVGIEGGVVSGVINLESSGV